MHERLRPALRRCLALGPRAGDIELRMLVDELGKRCLEKLSESLHDWPGYLSDADLATLIKVFTRLEGLDPPYRLVRGSTTSVPSLLQRLAACDPFLAKELTTWAFHSANNPYIPFGTSNAERLCAASVADYHRLRAERLFANAQVEENQQQAARQRAAERARQHVAARAEHARSNARRSALLEELDRLPDAERLERIACCPEFPVGAFPAQWASLHASSQLPPETRSLLLRRLVRAPRGPWQRLAAALREDPQGKPRLVWSATEGSAS